MHVSTIYCDLLESHYSQFEFFYRIKQQYFIFFYTTIYKYFLIDEYLEIKCLILFKLKTAFYEPIVCYFIGNR